MKTLGLLIKRNIKLFSKDKGLLLSSLITPLILIVLFVTFLGNVYRDSLEKLLPAGTVLEKSLEEGIVGGWLFSSLLATTCVTLAFCSNFIMVQDKTNNALNDMLVSPVKKTTLAISYFLATELITFVICIIALIIGLVYLAIVGWYLSFTDVLLAVLDVFLLTLFGTVLSSIINCFLFTQGQMSAVGVVVSSIYGFVCGAYMPISSLSNGLQKVMGFLPGTYATSLIRNHLMSSSIAEMVKAHFSSLGEEVASIYLTNIKDGFDLNTYFLGNKVSILACYIIIIVAIILLLSIYVVINIVRKEQMK